MRRAIFLFSLFASLTCISSVKALDRRPRSDEIYLCRGIYQNFPCAPGERGYKINPDLGPRGSLTRERPIGRELGAIGSDTETPRGRLRSFGPSEPSRRRDTRVPARMSNERVPPTTLTDPQRIQRLSDLSENLPARIRLLKEQEGLDTARNHLDHLTTEHNIVCTGVAALDNADLRARCDTIKDALLESRREVTNF